MEPIINPLWFYLIDVVDGVKSTSTLVETHMILHEYKTTDIANKIKALVETHMILHEYKT